MRQLEEVLVFFHLLVQLTIAGPELSFRPFRLHLLPDLLGHPIFLVFDDEL